MSKINKVKRCRICRSLKLYKFLDLGSMPIPNGFLSTENLLKKEHKYPLACFFCENCGLVQLTHVVNPKIMFRNYVYVPSGSKVMMNNFSNLAYQANERKRLSRESLVIDIGSNDGSLLNFFQAFGARVLGIDPARNIAKLARMRGIPTLTRLFNLRTAKMVVKKHGKAEVVTATNVIAHINDTHSVFRGVLELLEPGGIFITEFPYHLDLITKNQFDTIYHEHLSYFSLKPWRRIVDEYGLEIVDVQRLRIHGGSIRLTHSKKRSRKGQHNKTVEYLIGLEEYHGLHSKESYDAFTKRILNLKEELTNLLRVLKKQKKHIVGYGAAAKGNVLTNFFDIGRETLDYIVDSTSYKQGLYTPGKHIPVYPENKLLEDMPEYTLILAWNFADEIIKKQEQYRKKGGRFIIPIPVVKII